MNAPSNSAQDVAQTAAAPRRMLKTQDYLVFMAALISFLFSVILWFTGDAEAGIFVGLWVPSIIAFGIYIRVVAGGANHE